MFNPPSVINKISQLNIPTKIGLFFLLGLIVYGFLTVRTTKAIDYFQFWAIPQAIKTMDLDNVYGRRDRSRIGIEFYNRAMKAKKARHTKRAATNRRNRINPGGTPLLYAMFSLVSTGNYEVDYEFFRVFTLTLYFFGILFCCWLFRLNLFVTIISFWFFTFWFFPFRHDIYAGNVNAIQMGFLVLYFIMLMSWKTKIGLFTTGLMMGFFLLFKPNMAYCFVLISLGWLIQGNWMKLITHALGVIVAALFGYTWTVLIYGQVCTWAGWNKGLNVIVFRPYFLDKTFLGGITHIGHLFKYKMFAVILIVIPALILVYSRIKNGTRFVFDFSSESLNKTDYVLDFHMVWLGVLIYLVSGPLVHGHYFTLCIPVLLFLVRPKLSPHFTFHTDSNIRLFIGLLCTAMLSLQPFLFKNALVPFWDLSMGSFVACFILYLTLLWSLYQSKNHLLERSDG